MNTTELAQSLPAVLASVPDPRGLRGRRHPLPAILTLAVCAMLSGARSLYAIHQWGRQQDAATVQAMGFTRPRTPAVGSLTYRIPSAGRGRLRDRSGPTRLVEPGGTAGPPGIAGAPLRWTAKPARCGGFTAQDASGGQPPYRIPSAGRGRLRDRSGPVEAGRDCRKGAPLRWTAKPCGGFTAKSCPGCAWWPDMLTNPAWW